MAVTHPNDVYDEEDLSLLEHGDQNKTYTAEDLKDHYNLPSVKKNTDDPDSEEEHEETEDGEEKKTDSKKDSSKKSDDKKEKPSFTDNIKSKLSAAGQNKKKLAAGGGIVGIIGAGAILVSTLLQGPWQFIDMSQLEQQFHLASGQAQSDDRTLKILRDLHYAQKGKIEDTRMGILARRMAPKFDAALAESGIVSRYTPIAGFKEGFDVDPSKLAGTQLADLQGKSPEDLQAYFEKNFPGVKVDITTDPGKLFIDSSDLGVYKNFSLNRFMLKAAGYGSKSSVVGARVMGQRDGVTWHPIKKLDAAIFKSVEARFTEWKKNRVKDIDKGAAPEIDPAAAEGTDPADNPNAASDATNSATDTANDAGDTATKVASGDETAEATFTDHLSVKLGLGGVAAAGVLCAARGIDSQASEFKESQVVLPLIRMGMDGVALGNQVMNGQEVSLEQLGFFEKQMHSAEGSWINSQSIQAELGHNAGKAASSTLTTIGNGTPFSFLNGGGVIGTTLGGVCSSAGTGIQIGLSFLGGPVSAAFGLAVGATVGPPIMSAIAHWLSGQAIDVLGDSGPDFGNDVDVGVLLGANGQAISSGGKVLTSSEANKVNGVAAQSANAEFESHSIAYKLFNLDDPKSVSAQILDKQNPDPVKDVSNIAASMINIPKLLSIPMNLFSGKASANPLPYDYGVPVVGFSEDEMNNPAYEHPFENANTVVDSILPANPDWVGPGGRIFQCFGDTVDPTTYDVTSFGDVGDEPNYATNNGDYNKANCNDSSEDWTRVRFYLNDTINITSLACYEGDEDSCSAVDLNSTSASASTPTAPTTTATGDVSAYKDPLRAIDNLVPERIDQGVDFGGTGPVYAIGDGTVVNIAGPGWPGNGIYISYTLSDGPAAGKTVYVAECMTPAVTVGQKVTSDTVVGTMTDCGSGIETGWSEPSSDEAKAHTVYHEGDTTAYGLNFSQFLIKIGSTGGVQSGGAPVGSLDPGWPTW